jgi:hypothetical protein
MKLVSVGSSPPSPPKPGRSWHSTCHSGAPLSPRYRPFVARSRPLVARSRLAMPSTDRDNPTDSRPRPNCCCCCCCCCRRCCRRCLLLLLLLESVAAASSSSTCYNSKRWKKSIKVRQGWVADTHATEEKGDMLVLTVEVRGLCLRLFFPITFHAHAHTQMLTIIPLLPVYVQQ